jgi:hypothetical protein
MQIGKRRDMTTMIVVVMMMLFKIHFENIHRLLASFSESRAKYFLNKRFSAAIASPVIID